MSVWIHPRNYHLYEGHPLLCGGVACYAYTPDLRRRRIVPPDERPGFLRCDISTEYLAMPPVLSGPEAT